MIKSQQLHKEYTVWKIQSEFIYTTGNKYYGDISYYYMHNNLSYLA